MRIVEIIIKIMLVLSVLTGLAQGAENPDELYRQGRFEEAEKAYSESDMNNPKDIRYRYNRGCAAFQKEDYQGATASFSSVLRRAKDDDIKFRASFNLGNSAFKQGDFQTAIHHYRSAVKYNPMDEDSRYNLELALRALEKQKLEKEKEEKQKQEGQQGQEGQDGDQGDGNQEPGSDNKAGKTDSDKEDGNENEAENKKHESGGNKNNEQDKPDQEEQEDLSGQLTGQNDMPENRGEEESEAQARVLMDQNKAQALLDNIKEDPSKIYRFRIPKDKRKGVASGKDW